MKKRGGYVLESIKKAGAVIALVLFMSCYVQQPMQITWIDPDKEQKDVMANLANRLAPTLLQFNCRTVAVLPFFDMNNRNTSCGRALSLDFQTALMASQGQFNIVERDWGLLIKTVIKEMEMSQTGFLDEKVAARAGRMIGADTLILGWVYDTGNNFKVTVQVLNIERAKVLTMADGLLSRTSFRIQQCSQYIW